MIMLHKFIKNCFLIYICLFFQTIKGESNNELEAIYQEDNRQEVRDTLEEYIKEMSSGVVLITDKEKLSKSKQTNYMELPQKTLEQKFFVCKNERFSEQISPGNCSGFLVSPRHIITAGHCVTYRSSCSNTAFIFDFSVTENGKDLSLIPKDNVFYCAKVVETKISLTSGHDFAVIELDRATKNRAIFPLAKDSRNLSERSKLTVIGHPLGLPQKISSGVVLVNNLKSSTFTTNLDTYIGNSGSPVINNQTKLTEGMIVGGNQDFYRDGSCYKSKVYTFTESEGEKVLRSSNFTHFVL
mgnify:CR=1 FL=1